MTRQTPVVAQLYDRWAEVYDHDSNPLIGLEEPVVHRLISNPSGNRVLDLGCGTGRHSLWLTQNGAMVTAVDFSQGMIGEAQRKPGARDIHFIHHDINEPLPIEKETFDWVVSGLVLEHLTNLGSFFKEISRVLKNGGRALVTAMHPAMFLKGAKARFTDPSSGEIVQPGSHDHTLSEMVMAVIQSGLGITQIVEKAPDQEFATRFPRAEKYIGWPMLVVFDLRKG